MSIGSFELILGCMFSGKTSELINKYDRYSIGGKSCLMIKYKGDTRYSQHEVVTHNGIKINAITCEVLHDIECMSILSGYQVVCIDEIQFYKDAHIYCDKWANDGKIVIASGLSGTSERKPFDIISLLVPIADKIRFKQAITRENGNDASFSDSKVEKTSEKLIGGADKYRAVDRETYFADNNRLQQFYNNIQTEIDELYKKN